MTQDPMAGTQATDPNQAIPTPGQPPVQGDDQGQSGQQISDQGQVQIASEGFTTDIKDEEMEQTGSEHLSDVIEQQMPHEEPSTPVEPVSEVPSFVPTAVSTSAKTPETPEISKPFVPVENTSSEAEPFAPRETPSFHTEAEVSSSPEPSSESMVAPTPEIQSAPEPVPTAPSSPLLVDEVPEASSPIPSFSATSAPEPTPPVEEVPTEVQAEAFTPVETPSFHPEPEPIPTPEVASIPVPPSPLTPPTPPQFVEPTIEATPVQAAPSSAMDINSMLGSLGTKMEETMQPGQVSLDAMGQGSVAPMPTSGENSAESPAAPRKSRRGLISFLIFLLLGVGGYFYLSTTRPLLIEEWEQKAMSLLGLVDQGSTAELIVPEKGTGDNDITTPLADSLQQTGGIDTSNPEDAVGPQEVDGPTELAPSTGSTETVSQEDQALEDAVAEDVFGDIEEAFQTDEEKIQEHLFVIDDLEIQTKAIADEAERTQDKKTYSIAQGILKTIVKVREDAEATDEIDAEILGNSVNELKDLFAKISASDEEDQEVAEEDMAEEETNEEETHGDATEE